MARYPGNNWNKAGTIMGLWLNSITVHRMQLHEIKCSFPIFTSTGTFFVLTKAGQCHRLNLNLLLIVWRDFQTLTVFSVIDYTELTVL